MKKQIIFFLLILSSFSGFTQIMSEWSGTARFRRHSFSAVNKSRSETIYTIDISFKNGIGTATAFYSVDISSSDNGGVYSEKGSCTATASTEFALTLSDDGKHYYVAMAVPACTGVLSINRYGTVESREFGMDETNYQLEYKERGDDPNVLKGEENEKTNSEGGYTIESYSWNFSRNTMPPDLIVLSPNYESWIPAASDDEDRHGNYITVGLTLQRPDGKPLDIKAKEFFVQLINTSREPGVTINYPSKAMIKGKYDMTVADNDFQQAKYFEGQKFTIPSEDGETGSFHILSFDGGALTTLEVKAILTDGTEIKGHYAKPDGPTSIPYPFRDFGRKIAKAWLLANGNPNDEDDKESTPGTSHNGDGLTAYEEYRGVLSEGMYKRLSPAKKEIGIRVSPDDYMIFEQGINLFAALTHITPIICYPGQMEDTRIFNRNSLTHRMGSQYGLYIQKKDLGTEKGAIFPSSDFKTTANTNAIYINTAGMLKLHDSLSAIKKLPYAAEQDINSTVAHYLCQAVGIPPHGSSGGGEILDATKQTGITIMYLQENGTPVTGIPAIKKQLIGISHNDASGDVSCVMCANNKYEWVYEKNGNNISYRKVPVVSPGNKLCISPTGTLHNKDGMYFGNANTGRGNCIKHIKVKSW